MPEAADLLQPFTREGRRSLSFEAFPVESAGIKDLRVHGILAEPPWTISLKMIDTVSKIKPAVRQLQAYTLKNFAAQVKINQNENPYDVPEIIKAEANEAMIQKVWSRYPAFVPSSLISKLAKFSGWKSAGILVGNGS